MAIGFGTDTWCVSALVPGRMARGPQVVLQALVRRWTTPRGTLRRLGKASTYGFDVCGYLGAVGYPTAVAALPGLMAAEGLKDDRVALIEIDATAVTDAKGETSITLDVSVTLKGSSGSYPLTLSVNEVSLEVIGSMAA